MCLIWEVYKTNPRLLCCAAWLIFFMARQIVASLGHWSLFSGADVSSIQ